MSNINLNNCEAYLLDYVEQNLSPDMVAELMLFLEQHPEVKAELEAFENVSLNTDGIMFHQKENLKKIAIEDLMIAEIEGLNSSQETKELFDVIDEKPAYATLFANYQKTILKPATIIFADKAALKRKETKVIPLYYWYSSVAAVLVVAFTLSPFITGDENQFAVDTRMFPVNNKKVIEETAVKPATPINIDVKEQINNTATSNNITNSKNVLAEKSIKTNKQKQAIKSTPKVIETKTSEPTKKEYITINPPQKEYIEIEPYVAEVNTSKQPEEYLSVSELLKKEAQKRLLENEVKNNSTELVAANVVAKVLGKNAAVETAENENGEVKEYALNIGGFSISRKIKK
ncbi:MAG: hypothetical protein AB7O47_01265 [Flavobacteriales bacterium]